MPARYVATSLTVLLAACTCRPEPTITGHVVDFWGHEVPGARVTLENGETLTADEHARFKLPMASMTPVKINAEGYFDRATEVVPLNLDADYTEEIEIIPLPPTEGIFLIGESSYQPLPATPVERVGDDTQGWVGVRDVGSVSVDGAKVRLVLHVPARRADGSDTALQLVRLTKVDQADVPGPDGTTVPTPIGLWTGGDVIDGESKTVIDAGNRTFRVEDLSAGAYAMVQSGLLTTQPAATFDAIPAELRVAWPLQVTTP